MRGPAAIQVLYKLQFWKQAGIASFQPHSCFWWLLSWLPVLFNKITFLFSPLIFSMSEQNLSADVREGWCRSWWEGSRRRGGFL